MSEYPLTSKQVLSLRWRDELNRILNSSNPSNGERLFLACFLRDRCNWNEYGIVELIEKYAKWANLNYLETVTNVNRIFEKRERFPNFKSATVLNKIQGSGNMDNVETWTQETQPGQTEKKLVETTRRCCDVVRNVENNNLLSPVGFQVSTDYQLPEQETTMSRDIRAKAPPQTVRTITTLTDGDRFYRICEKEGSFGGFFSLESGWISDVEYEGKQLKVPGRSDKYFTLPNQEDTIQGIISGLQQLLSPVEVEVTKKKK